MSSLQGKVAIQPLILPPIIQTAEAAPAYWFLGILWIILVDGEQTDGRYSLMEQLMPQDVAKQWQINLKLKLHW